MKFNKIRIDLSKSKKDDSYDILIGRGIFSPSNLAPVLGSVGVKKRAFIVTSRTVNRLYGKAMKRLLLECGIKPVFAVVPDGEETKSQKYLSLLYDNLIKNRFERNEYVIAFGGGVVGDLAGFAAATYLRGLNLVQFPTTLLSDVDSSVGGKTGIDHPGGKNLIGAFYQPRLVVIDTDFLKSLDSREFKNGLSEVIKYGIVLDRSLFKSLESGMDKILCMESPALTRIIKWSCAIKAGVVERDEKETGLRSVLNFGHSIGHAIETLYNYKGIKHGEAVAIGMAFAATASNDLGVCDGKTKERIINLIKKSGLPVDMPPFSPKEYVEAMKLDKKVSSKVIKFVLVREIGRFEFKELDFKYLFKLLERVA